MSVPAATWKGDKDPSRYLEEGCWYNRWLLIHQCYFKSWLNILRVRYWMLRCPQGHFTDGDSPIGRHRKSSVWKYLGKTFHFDPFLLVHLNENTCFFLSVCAFKAPSWQRMDIAFHSATPTVTRLPFPPQGLLSWEVACQPETTWRWRVREFRFDWDTTEMVGGGGL